MKDLRDYIIEEVKKNFTLEDSERQALADCIGIMLGNLGEDDEIAQYKEFKDSLTKDEIKQFDNLCDCLDNKETYRKISRRTIIDDIPLIQRLYKWMEEKNMLDEQWDLIDAMDKINEA